MDSKEVRRHYRLFKWAVSKDWKHKNKLYFNIQNKMKVLTDEYGLKEIDIVDDLFSQYWDRQHYLKYDEAKGSLPNWIAHYVNNYLNHIIRCYSVRDRANFSCRLDPLDPRNSSSVCRQKDNTRDDPDFQPELFIDKTDPESLLIAKETLEKIHETLDEVEVQHLIGEITFFEAAEKLGISAEAFRKRIQRRKNYLKELFKDN